jgi:hypothetical protein
MSNRKKKTKREQADALAARADWVLELLIEIDVPIFTALDDGYIMFISNLDVCNDGSGPKHGDPSYQSQTAYYNNGKFLNADVDKYIVIPPQVRSLIAPVVMGCQARMTNLALGIWSAAVCGEIGPDDKTGEASYCLAKEMNPKISHNTGDSRRVYLYELWPGIPAVVGDNKYKLEPS